jgi:hypothetical protein
MKNTHSEITHTPAPWRVTGTKTSPLGVRFQIENVPGTHPCGVVAEAMANGFTNMDTAEANARLIASAPELFDALRYAKAELEKLRGIYDRDDYKTDEAVALAQSALDKVGVLS